MLQESLSLELQRWLYRAPSEVFAAGQLKAADDWIR